jgi:hypothetical protein
MATTFPWGESVTVLMELGFPVNPFTLDSASLGVLDSNALDGTLLGDDVSSFCREVSISRGRSDQLANFSAGTATLRLINNDRRFDPINEDSPYWDSTLGRSGVTPRRKVTILLDGKAVFTGRITDIDVIYDYNLSEVVFSASDDFVLLANTTTGDAFTPSEELSGARVERILDLASVGYPAASRSINTGTTALGAYEIGANTNALTYLQRCADAEQGYLYVAKDGTLTFTDRITTVFASIAATFSDTGSDIPYSSLSVLYGQEFLYNRISTQTEGGAVQNADDTDSQDEFGITTLALSDLLLASDAAALTLANTLLDRYSQPVYRFDDLAVSMNRITSGQRSDVLDLEIADIVEITRTYATGSPASVTQTYSIEGISHSLSAGAHNVVIRLAPAELVFPFTLDDATYGVLDASNALS